MSAETKQPPNLARIILIALGVLLIHPVHALPSRDNKKPPLLNFYVSTRGKDTWPGTRQRPFATVLRARDAIRAAREKAPSGFGGAVVSMNSSRERR